MPSNPSNRDLKTFAIIGLVGLVLFFVLPLYLGYFVLLHFQTTPNAPAAPTQPVTYNEPLGELGSHCGGPEHLPCRPGLECSNDPKVANSLGTCGRSSATGTLAFTGQVNDACTSGTICSAGLFCKGITSGAATCATIAEDSPHILSIKLAGTQPTQGWYQAKAGAVVQVTVQTANAETVSAKLESLSGAQGTTKDLGQMTKAPGGTYTTSFTMDTGLSASFEVLVTAKDGDQSALAVRVATVK